MLSSSNSSTPSLRSPSYFTAMSSALVPLPFVAITKSCKQRDKKAPHNTQPYHTLTQSSLPYFRLRVVPRNTGENADEKSTLTARLPLASSALRPALPQCSTGGVVTVGNPLAIARLPPSRSRPEAANSMRVAIVSTN